LCAVPKHNAIGLDSGLSHVAGALGVGTVALFGPTREERTRPIGPRVCVLARDLECRPCIGTPRFRTCRRRRACMEMTAQEVAEAALTVAR